MQLISKIRLIIFEDYEKKILLIYVFVATIFLYFVIRYYYNKYIFPIKYPNQHIMENSINRYIDIKLHDVLKNNPNINNIVVRGKYNRESSIIFKYEKTDKLFNWKRPTLEIINDKFYINVFPGFDYIKHYFLLIKTYYVINNKHIPKITFEQTNSSYIFNTILNNTNFKQIPNADIIILGVVHHLVNDFQGNGDFKWVIQNIENKKVMYLGCEFSIWGDIAGRLAELLIKYKNANTIIYIGKLGTLNKNIKSNITLATGNISYLNGKLIKWNNIFDNLNHNKYNIYYEKHYTLPSVIQETKIWFNKNKNKYNFVDPEIGQIAYYCRKNKANFSYLHIVSDNLNKNSNEDLSNEKNIEILEKRNKLYEQIKNILIDKKLMNNTNITEPLEIEVKVKINNIDYINNMLNNVIKAEFIKEKNQIDTYYKHTKKQELQGKNTYLRIREEKDNKYIAMHFKNNNNDWVELETQIEKPEIMKQIFNNIDFKIDAIVNKTRKVYKKDNTEFEIDYIEGLGYFLEIESDTKENLNKYIKIFNLTEKQINEFENIAYVDMIRNINSK